MPPQFDLVVAGTGFASTFFLEEWLRSATADARVLVLERGPNRTHTQRMERRERHPDVSGLFVNETPDKPWVFSTWMGGGSRCWAACTPRMLPNDFRIRTLYDKGTDWPLSYDDLEPFYVEAEARMRIAGPSDPPWPMSKPYPQPPHAFSDADLALKAAFPDQIVQQPTARPSRPDHRPACCGNAVCSLCPTDAKFTIVNTMADVYRDPRVTVRYGCRVDTVETDSTVATGVRYRRKRRAHVVAADRVALGCNALFNPAILLRSGIDQGPVGRYLVEQRSKMAGIQLDGIEGFRASTYVSGLIYRFADGPFRRDAAACIIETHNSPRLIGARNGSLLECYPLKMIFEDLPQADNRVEVDAETGKPVVTYTGVSQQLLGTQSKLEGWIEELIAPLPNSGYGISRSFDATEAHILGTHRMGADPGTSVVDAHQLHHRFRNLSVLGGGSFPSCAPANPSLTIAALSIRSARSLA